MEKRFPSNSVIYVAIALCAMVSVSFSRALLIADQVIPVYQNTDCVWSFSANTANPCNQTNSSCLTACPVSPGGCPSNMTEYSGQIVGNAISGGSEPYRNENQACTRDTPCVRVEHDYIKCSLVHQFGPMFEVCVEEDETQICYNCGAGQPGDWSVVINPTLYDCPPKS